MRQQGPDYIVGKSEIITIKVEKNQDPYLASFSRIDGASWISTEQNGLIEIRKFQAPNVSGATVDFVITFDFQDPADHYDETVSGNQGGQVVVPLDPPALALNHHFIVA